MRAAPGVAMETVGLASAGEPSAFCSELSTCFAGSSSSLPFRASEFGSSARSSPTLGSRCLRRGGCSGCPGVAVAVGVAVDCSGGAVGSTVGSGVRVGVSVCAGVSLGMAVGVGVGVSTGPRSVTDCTGAGSAGSSIDSTEEPGGTSIVSVSCSPVTSVTET